MIMFSSFALLAATCTAFVFSGTHQLAWRTIVKDNKAVGNLREVEAKCLQTIRSHVIASYQSYPQFKDFDTPQGQFVVFKPYAGPKSTKIVQEVLEVKKDQKAGQEVYALKATILDSKRREGGRVTMTLTATEVTGPNGIDKNISLTLFIDQFDIVTSQNAATGGKSASDLVIWDSKVNNPTAHAIHLIHKVEKYMVGNVVGLIKKAHRSKDSYASKDGFLFSTVKIRLVVVIKEAKSPFHFVYQAAAAVSSPKGHILTAVWSSLVNEHGDDQFNLDYIKLLPEYFVKVPAKPQVEVNTAPTTATTNTEANNTDKADEQVQ